MWWRSAVTLLIGVHICAADLPVSSLNLQMYGNIYPWAVFYTNISVGTPPQTVSVVLDTGSSDLLIGTPSCKTCGGGELYNPHSSTTARHIPYPPPSGVLRCTNDDDSFVAQDEEAAQSPDTAFCQFNNSYVTCSSANPNAICYIRGTLWHDVFSLTFPYPHVTGKTLTASVTLGGITSQSSDFDQFDHIHGIWGLANRVTSQTNASTPMDALVAAGEIRDMFAMCLLPGYNTGVLTLGGVDPALFMPQQPQPHPHPHYDSLSERNALSDAFLFTPMLPMEHGNPIIDSGYPVNMTDMRVNGTSLGFPPAVYNFDNCIVDSGTTQLILPPEPFVQLQIVFEQQCASQPLKGVCGVPANQSLFDGTCYPMTAEELAQFPSLEVYLLNSNAPATGENANVDDVSIVLTLLDGFDYLYQGDEQGRWCLGIASGTDGSIIGDIVMQHYYTLFDRESQRIGFAPVDIDGCLTRVPE